MPNFDCHDHITTNFKKSNPQGKNLHEQKLSKLSIVESMMSDDSYG